MANIKDLFAPTEAAEVKFDISKIKTTAEKIVKMQKQVGGRPRLTAKVGAGGIRVFTVSNGNRDIVIEKFSGVIIANHSCNALFPPRTDDDKVMNTPPICSSVDGETGVVLETGECRSCANCPHNVFGTAGKGKACKNMHRLYILTEDVPIPMTLTLPPTSLELWRNYAIMDVAAAGLELTEIITEFGLINAESSNGNKYSIVNFKLVGRVNGEVKDFCEGLSENLEQTPRPAIAAEEYNRESLSEGTASEFITQDEPEDGSEFNVPTAADDDELPDWSGSTTGGAETEAVTETDATDINFDEL